MIDATPKSLNVPSSAVFSGTHFFLRLHLHLYFLKLNKWDLLFWEKRRNVTLILSYLLKAIRYLQCAEISYNIGLYRPMYVSSFSRESCDARKVDFVFCKQYTYLDGSEYLGINILSPLEVKLRVVYKMQVFGMETLSFLTPL